MLEEEDDTKVLLTILKHGASIICLHLGHTWVQYYGGDDLRCSFKTFYFIILCKQTLLELNVSIINICFSIDA